MDSEVALISSLPFVLGLRSSLSIKERWLRIRVVLSPVGGWAGACSVVNPLTTKMGSHPMGDGEQRVHYNSLICALDHDEATCFDEGAPGTKLTDTIMLAYYEHQATRFVFLYPLSVLLDRGRCCLLT